MNLADAIRLAAQSTGESLGQPQAASRAPKPGKSQRRDPVEGQTPTKERKTERAPDTGALPSGHNIVRLELVLNPEQLKVFLGAVTASQHSVLTLREAAQYLRVSQGSLESMAQDGAVPAMTVDGKWRFARQALEEWLNAHPKRKEA